MVPLDWAAALIFYDRTGRNARPRIQGTCRRLPEFRYGILASSGERFTRAISLSGHLLEATGGGFTVPEKGHGGGRTPALNEHFHG
jgi:hypothetical protein